MTEEKENNIDSTNIFDDFSDNEELKKEVEKMKVIKEKDGYYYLGIISNFIVTINTLLILSFIVFGIYIYIQDKKNLDRTPVCDFFVKRNGEYENCSSVSHLLEKYRKKYDNEKIVYYKSVLSLVEKVYSNSNLLFSKDISFLLDKTDNKMRPLDILEEFDKLKNEFEPINKSRIQCQGASINSNFVLELKCSAYSGNWDTNILGFSGDSIGQNKIEGTSISRAVSFINFLEQKEKSKFIILNKQKEFKFEEIVDNNGYTRKTDFDLKLKFKNNNISLPKK